MLLFVSAEDMPEPTKFCRSSAMRLRLLAISCSSPWGRATTEKFLAWSQSSNFFTARYIFPLTLYIVECTGGPCDRKIASRLFRFAQNFLRESQWVILIGKTLIRSPAGQPLPERLIGGGKRMISFPQGSIFVEMSDPVFSSIISGSMD